MQGQGKYASDFADGSKKEAYQYIDFMYKNCIFSIVISDQKKRVEESMKEFLDRFELI